MLSAEISELRRHTKREGVNMDYLKNVVLQYMSFPVQCPERSSLVPVIAMLLQFNTKEFAHAEKALKEPIWGQRPVTEVKRALHKASSSSYSLSLPTNNQLPNTSEGLTLSPTPSPQSKSTFITSSSPSTKPLKIVSDNNVLFTNNSRNNVAEKEIDLLPIASSRVDSVLFDTTLQQNNDL